jgi:hypothetical protein
MVVSSERKGRAKPIGVFHQGALPFAENESARRFIERRPRS